MNNLNTTIPNESRIAKITGREMEILYLIATEYSNKEIAAQLHISVGTVEVHRRNLFLKTGATNMAGLINRAYQYGLLMLRSNIPVNA